MYIYIYISFSTFSNNALATLSTKRNGIKKFKEDKGESMAHALHVLWHTKIHHVD